MSEENSGHVESSSEMEEEEVIEEGAEVDALMQDDPQDSDYTETSTRHPPRESEPRCQEKKKRSGPRPWTAEEEVLFLDALEKYGRSWKECAQHVGTRNPKAIASHAQKHLIKLCLDGKRLPDKVLETGIGYTLSGKPLDPISPSANTYGFKPEIIRSLTPEQLDVVRGGIVMENLGMAPRPRRRGSSGAGSIKKKRPEARTNKTVRSKSASTLKDDEWEYLRKYRTEYALKRPQRAAARNRRIQIGSTSDNHELVDCEEFMRTGEAGARVQPFNIDIAAEALLLMDFHAHLCEFESIGLLGGTWNAEERHLTVREALPCRREPGSGGRTSVELDPESEVLCRQLLEEKGLISTGWYHSHPVFSATPSQKDIENQRNYQTLFRTETAGHEPFVGLIVSPYDIELMSPISKTCGFIVQKTDGGIRPYRLRYQIVNRLETVAAEFVQNCEEVLHLTKSDASRVDLNTIWRDWTFQKEDIRSGAPLSKISKMRLSLMSYFADSHLIQAKDFVEELLGSIKKIWDVEFTPGDANSRNQ